ncbi:hypothetical protein QM012_008569 [Aureobasidium pullulans]|uniref:Uncharacterized protein n=1 Tax=Aureobasidium pullulans TaxID=5580 RepID=A0ABR0TK36_AURPU
MRTLFLLAVSTGDWDVAEEARLTFETLKYLACKEYRNHSDKKIHATLRCLCESLDELRELQEEEALGDEIEAAALSQGAMHDDDPV